MFVERATKLHTSDKDFNIATDYNGEDAGYNYKYTPNRSIDDLYDNSYVP